MSTRSSGRVAAAPSSVFLALVIATIGLAVPAAAETWTFSNLVEVGVEYSSFEAPAINGLGVAVCFAWTAAGDQAIVRIGPDGAQAVAIADDAPFVSFTGVGGFQLVNEPDLDDDARVIFRAYTYDPGTGIYYSAAYLHDGDATVALTTVGDTGIQLDWCNPTIGDDGTAALVARDGDSPLLQAGPAPDLVTVVDAAGAYLEFMGEVAASADGKIAFRATKDTWEWVICRWDGNAVVDVASVQGDGYVQLGYQLAINSAGQVAFGVQVSEWVHAIGIGTGDGPSTVVIDNEGPYDSFGHVGIDGSGRIVFTAELDDGSGGVFAGPDPVADKVIVRGDPLFGSTVTSAETGRYGVNEAGQVGFHYQLADGRAGIALATRGGGGVAVADVVARPAAQLHLPCPNPFNPRTTVAFTLDRAGTVDLAVYALDGRRVAALASGYADAGEHAAMWDGCDDAGRPQSSGTYLARLVAGGTATQVKLVLLR
jgi:hypothetical protein